MATTITLASPNGGRGNIAATMDPAAAPRRRMTPLTPGHGGWRISRDGVYGYLHEDGAGWMVKHLLTGIWITDLAGADVAVTGFGSLAAARRWTHTGPVPAASTMQPPTRATVPA